MPDPELLKILNQIALGQKEEANLLSAVKSDVSDIKESIRRIHMKLDDTTEKATINARDIEHLKQNFLDYKQEHDKKIDLLHKKVHSAKDDAIQTATKNIMIKLYGVVFANAATIIAALIVAFATIKLK